MKEEKLEKIMLEKDKEREKEREKDETKKIKEDNNIIIKYKEDTYKQDKPIKQEKYKKMDSDDEYIHTRNFSDSDSFEYSDDEIYQLESNKLKDNKLKRKHDRKENKKLKKGKKNSIELNNKSSKLDIDRKKILLKERSLNTMRTSTISFIESNEIDHKLYCIDTVGDFNNAVYESLNRADIPIYFRLYDSKNVIIGSKPYERKFFIHFIENYKNSNAIELDKYSKLDRYFGETHVIRSREKSLRSIKFDKKFNIDPQIVMNFSYIGFDSKTSVPELGSIIPYTDKYTEVNNEQEDEKGETIDEWIIHKNLEFNNLTAREPNNINHWIEFVMFQDEIHLRQRNKNTAPLYARKLSILEIALQYHRKELMSWYLRIASEYYSRDEVESKYNAALKENYSAAILLDFLDFKLSSAAVSETRAVYRSCLLSIKDRYSYFYSNISRLGPTHEIVSSLDLCEELYRTVLIKWSISERCSGFSELSTSIFQIILEYNMCRPLNKNVDVNRLVDELQVYWESEVPRFGELGSLNWNGWDAKLNSLSIDSVADNFLNLVFFPEPKLATSSSLPVAKCYIPENVITGSINAIILCTFVDNEKSNEKLFAERGGVSVFNDSNSGQDRNLTSIITDESLTSVVLFEDVSFSLFEFKPTVWIELVLSYVKHFGLPDYSIVRSESIKRNNYFISYPDLFENISGLAGPKFLAPNYNLFKSLLPTYLLDYETINDGIISNLSDWLYCPIVLSTDSIGAIDLILQYTIYRCKTEVPLECIESLKVTYFLFLSHFCGIEIFRKFARKILKSEPTNIKLWLSYALIEGRNMYYNESKKVFSNVFTMIKSSQNFSYMCLLVSAWIEVSLYNNKNDDSELLIILSSLFDNELINNLPSTTLSNFTIPSIKLLQIRKSYVNQLSVINPTDWKPTYDTFMPSSHASSLWLNFIWFHYLSLGFESAIAIFHKLLSSISNMTSDNSNSSSFFIFVTSLESILPLDYSSLLPQLNYNVTFELRSNQHLYLMEQLLILVLFHVKRNPYTPPRVLRSVLEYCLFFFPSHHLFLSIYSSFEIKGRSSSRLRWFFDKQLESQNNQKLIVVDKSITYMFALVSEFYRPGASHRIRALFEKAQIGPEKNCVGLWRLYIRFELWRDNKYSAKKLFYRAIHQVRRNKLLWLDSLTWLSSIFNSKEMIEVLDGLKVSNNGLRWYNLPDTTYIK